jgi:hypothetical protein
MVVWQTLVPLAVVAQDVLDEAWHGCLCAVLLMAGLMWLRWNCSMPARPEICQDKHPAISIPDDLAHIAAIDRNILFKCPTLDRSRLDGSAKFCSSYRNSARSGSHLPTPSGRRKLSELRQLYRDFNNIGVRGFVLNGAPFGKLPSLCTKLEDTRRRAPVGCVNRPRVFAGPGCRRCGRGTEATEP